MTAQDIIQIITASAFIQCMCDIVAHYMIYQTDAYQNKLDQLASCQAKLIAAQSKVVKTVPDATGSTTTTTTTTTTATTTSSDKSNSNPKKSSATEKQQQLVQRLTQEHTTMLSIVALEHTRPTIVSAVLFVVLMYMLGTEHKGKIIGLLPFVPYRFIQRLLSLRGLSIDPHWLQLSMGDDDDVTATTTATNTNNDVSPSSIVLQELLFNVNNNNTYSTSRTAGGVIPGITSMTGQLCSFSLIYMLTSMSMKYYIQQLFSTAPPKGAESYLGAVAETPKIQAMVKAATGLDPNDFKVE